MVLRKRPVLCNYYLTYRCNAACSFCDIWERPSPYASLETVSQNLRDLKKLGVKVIDFTGGEPLLHRELPQMLRLAKGLGFITTITTNCLLYPKRAHELAGLVDMLHFSLDAATAEAHDKSRGVACFGHFEKSLGIATELGERPDILFTITDKSVADIEAVYEQFCRPAGRMLLLNPVFGYNEVGNSSLSLEHHPALRRWSAKPLIYLNEGFLALREAGGNQLSKPVCRAASTTIVISPENKLVLPCYHIGLQEIPIEGRLSYLYDSPEIAAARALEGRLPACQGCVINCYMQPSFATELTRYFWLALPSTLKYNYQKGTWRTLLPRISTKTKRSISAKL